MVTMKIMTKPVKNVNFHVKHVPQFINVQIVL